MQPKYDAIYRALVTSNVDSTNTGKIRVQCPQIGGLAEIRAAEPANIKDPIPNVGSTVWVAFSGGDITKPVYISNSDYLYLLSDGTTLVTQSLASASLPDPAQITIASGVASANTGASNAPHVNFDDVSNSSPVDLRVSGSVIKTTNNGSMYTWQSPSYQTAWAGTTSFIGVSPTHTLQYRKDAEDNTWFLGAFTCSTGANSVVFQLPGGYYNPSIQEGFQVQEKQAAGTYQVGFGYISTTGNFHIDLGNNFTRNNGDAFFVNAKIPIGNLS
jgi:hypothetical protein